MKKMISFIFFGAFVMITSAQSTQKEFLFKQQSQANFYIEGAGGGLTIAPIDSLSYLLIK